MVEAEPCEPLDGGGGGEGPRDGGGGAWDSRAELVDPDDGGGAMTTFWLIAPLLALVVLAVGYLAGWELPP
jgi:hypothetical protein